MMVKPSPASKSGTDSDSDSGREREKSVSASLESGPSLPRSPAHGTSETPSPSSSRYGSASSHAPKAISIEETRDAGIRRIASYIKSGKATKIVVLAGAGISTSAGIPDFRSPSTGLYANLDRLNLPHPEAVFSLDFFQDRPEPFWTLAKDLYPGKYFPTPTHYFFRLLHQKNVLLRVFTQNIDTLEGLSGLDRKLIVEAHGSFATAHCLSCRKEHSREYVLSKGVRDGKVVRCDKAGCGGLVKPDIVFFGESLPESFWRNISDLSKCDLLLIVGTSLTVTPFANLPAYVRPPSPRILINREPVGPFAHLPAARGSPGLGNRGYDFSLRRFLQGGTDDGPFETDEIWQGDSDEGVRALADELGWREELEEMIIAGRAELKAKWKAEAERFGTEPPGEGTASPALSEGRGAAETQARKVAREVKSVMRPSPPTSPPRLNDEPPDEEEAPEEAIRKLAKSIAENLGL